MVSSFTRVDRDLDEEVVQVRWKRINTVMVVAATVVSVAHTGAWAGPGSLAGQGTCGTHGEMTSGWEMLTPAECTQPDRDRACVQDRLQDGSCADGSAGCVEVRARVRSRSRDRAVGSTEGFAAAEVRGVRVPSSTDRATKVALREQERVRNLIRLEERLRLLEGRYGTGEGSPDPGGLRARLTRLMGVCWAGWKYCERPQL